MLSGEPLSTGTWSHVLNNTLCSHTRFALSTAGSTLIANSVRVSTSVDTEATGHSSNEFSRIESVHSVAFLRLSAEEVQAQAIKIHHRMVWENQVRLVFFLQNTGDNLSSMDDVWTCVQYIGCIAVNRGTVKPTAQAVDERRVFAGR